jgi:anhydro-N-acetylmuramic acid kinase
MGALELFLAEPYLPRVPQNTLDKNDFSEMINLVKELSGPDATATLTAMCAAGVVEAMQHCPRPPSKVFGDKWWTQTYRFDEDARSFARVPRC